MSSSKRYFKPAPYVDQQEIAGRLFLGQDDGREIYDTKRPFPFFRSTEKEAMVDFARLEARSFTHLVKKAPWETRSRIPSQLKPLEYIIGRDKCGLAASNFFHFSARMCVEHIHRPSLIQAWYNPAIRETLIGPHQSARNRAWWDTRDGARGFLMQRFAAALQFRPAVAKALYELLGVKRIYDPCGGWGDRLAAALATPSVEYYLCRDVNPLVLAGYAQQQQSYRGAVRSDFELKGSEVDCPRADFFDLVLTSPPYYTAEIYQPTDLRRPPDDHNKKGRWRGYEKNEQQTMQSTDKFHTLGEWLEGFLYRMLEYAWQSLRDGGYLALNVSDFRVHNRPHPIVEGVVQALDSLPGSHFVQLLGYELHRAPGAYGRFRSESADAEGGSARAPLPAEPILLYRKGRPLDFASLLPEEHQQPSLF